MQLRVAAVVLIGLALIASHAQATMLGNDDVAKGKTVVVDHTYLDGADSTFVASNAVDGETDTYWNGDGWGSMHWLKVDLGQTYLLSHVDLYGAGEAGGVLFDLYYSNDDWAWSDNTNWTLITLAVSLTKYNSPAKIDFNGEEARYLKYEVSRNGDWVALNEIAAYAAAVPEPAPCFCSALVLSDWQE